MVGQNWVPGSLNYNLALQSVSGEKKGIFCHSRGCVTQIITHYSYSDSSEKRDPCYGANLS